MLTVVRNAIGFVQLFYLKGVKTKHISPFATRLLMMGKAAIVNPINQRE